MNSLWGALPPVPEITTPASILSEQASALSDMTNGVVTGDALRVPSGKPDMIATELRATVPTLNNYRIRIVRVEHGILSYPCRVFDLINNKELALMRTEDAFRDGLKAILSDERLLSLLSNSIAQARAK
jgi:hypothetical protein